MRAINRKRATSGVRGANALAAAAVALAVCAPAMGQLAPVNVLLLYNSQNAESLAVRNAYIAARPGVVEFDLNNGALPTGTVTRAQYVSMLRDPVRNFINGVGGPPDRSLQIMAIATTRGLPSRIESPSGTADEFYINSGWNSVESDLTLLQQDLEAAAPVTLYFRYRGLIDNPLHRNLGAGITGFSRANVKAAKPFVLVPDDYGAGHAGQFTGLTPGDMYLVCRLDSAGTNVGQAGEVTPVQNIQALITRSLTLTLDRCQSQALLDEYAFPPAPYPLDSDDLNPLFPGGPDFEECDAFLHMAGFSVVHDTTFNFVTGPELADQVKPLFLLGTYGENHKAFASAGEDPPGSGTYVETYNIHPAAMFMSIESWNGTSIYTGGPGRWDHQQALDFIARGGSFTIPHVMEPFAFPIADLATFMPGMLANNLTFAEAAWGSISSLSWQHVPVGDPLARITVTGGAPFDRDNNGVVDVRDLYLDHATPMDQNCSGTITVADRELLETEVRANESADTLSPGSP